MNNSLSLSLLKNQKIFWIISAILLFLIFSPNLFLDFKGMDDYTFFHQYSLNDLKNVWIDNFTVAIDPISPPGYRPLMIYIAAFIFNIFGFNSFPVFSLLVLILIIKGLLSLKLFLYYVKNKFLALIGLLLAITNFDNLTHHFWAAEIASNICDIFILLTVIFLTKKKYYVYSLVCIIIAVLIKETAIPLLLLLPIVFWVKKEKKLFWYSFLIPIGYFTLRTLFLHTTRYDLSLYQMVHNTSWGMLSIFNWPFIYNYVNFFQSNYFCLLSIIILNLSIIVIISLSHKKLIENWFLILSAILFMGTFPFTAGARTTYFYILFLLILTVKLLENLNKKYQIAFSLIMAIAIMANVYSTDKYIYERYRSNSVYMYQDKIDILTGCGMNNYFIYRDKYREQLQYLQNRLNKDGRGSF
jgi:hypothetical protein